MEIKTTIKYNIKENLYHIEAYDHDGKIIPYASVRLYDTEYEAELAGAILRFMFSKIEDRKEFNVSEFDFNLKAVFRLLGTPGKW